MPDLGERQREKAEMCTPTDASWRSGCEETTGIGVCAPGGDRVGPAGPPHGEQLPLPGAATFPPAVLKEAQPTHAAWLVPTNQL